MAAGEERAVIALLELDRELVAHLAVALHRHIVDLRRAAAEVPPGVDLLASEMVARARSEITEGQSGSSLAAIAEALDTQRVPPILLDYDNAAGALSCSVATVKRMVAAGELPVVRLGGSLPRIPTSALHRLTERETP